MEDFARSPLRARVVTFRLTEEEYDWLKTQCDGSASSVSAAARNAVLAAPPTPVCALADSRYQDLGRKLDEIISLLTAITRTTADCDNPAQTGQQGGQVC